jgi:hypothetical protein
MSNQQTTGNYQARLDSSETTRIDIVARLREETNGGGLLRWCDPRVANEAAAEIVALRELLRQERGIAEHFREAAARAAGCNSSPPCLHGQ